MMKKISMLLVIMISCSYGYAQNKTDRELEEQVVGNMNRISDEVGGPKVKGSNISGLGDALDRAFERSRKKERIKELQRSGTSIERANTQRRASSSGKGAIGNAPTSRTSYGSQRRYSDSGSSESTSSKASDSEPNPVYAAEAQRNLNTWNYIDAKMQQRIEDARNWRPSHSVDDMIAKSRDGVKGNRDDGVEPEPVKPKGIKVDPLEGIIDDAEPAKEDSEYEEHMKEYKRMFNEDQDSLTDEQMDELIDYLEKK